jgi:hypothetical protein
MRVYENGNRSDPEAGTIPVARHNVRTVAGPCIEDVHKRRIGIIGVNRDPEKSLLATSTNRYRGKWSGKKGTMLE